jgi:2-oxoisovalerate dehydrogenase E2 component (dihydrolipoyl transacylase)
MPVLPPGGGVAICAVGRAAWVLEPRLGGGKRVWDYTPQEVVDGGMEGVLRCSVGWSGDHRVVCHLLTCPIESSRLVSESTDSMGVSEK